jgi:SAM-dependent methyltransferase
MQKQKYRLQERRLKIWTAGYLHYRYLWPNIEAAVQRALLSVPCKVPTILDIGCGHRPYSDLFGESNYIGLDHGTEDTSPDVVGDAMQLPIRSEAADIVFSTQVIEHVPNPGLMIRECYRVLKPGGYLILTGPFYWPLHEEPFDFHRFTKYGFAHYLSEAGFSEWEIKEDGGDWAQLFLSMSLRASPRWLAPLRVLINCAGVLLDSLQNAKLSPANYTILARR